MNGASTIWITYPMTSSPSTHTVPGRGQQVNASSKKKRADLILEGEKVIVEQHGRKSGPIILRVQKANQFRGLDAVLRPKFTLTEELITIGSEKHKPHQKKK